MLKPVSRGAELRRVPWCRALGVRAGGRRHRPPTGERTRARERGWSQVGVLALILALIVLAGASGFAAIWFDGWPLLDRSASVEPDREQAAAGPANPQPPPEPTTQAAPDPGREFDRDFSDLSDDVVSGVLMVRATTCDGAGIGSAFLVDRNRAVTAAHVVDGAVGLAVTYDGATYHATVVGLDTTTDVAVLHLAAELDGHAFMISDEPPVAGEPLAVIGHPLGAPVTITVGAASRVDDTLWPDFQLDVSISPGNSGGPVVRGDGEVVGMVVAKDREADGLSYALGADVMAARLADPNELPAPAPPSCSRPQGPEAPEAPELEPSDELHAAVVATFDDYFTGINLGDYEPAYEQLSPRLQEGMSVDEFAGQLWTSYDFGFRVRAVGATSDGASVWLEFTSLQAPEYGPDGESCTMWSLDYDLDWYGDRLVIDGATGHDGSDGHVPCS